MAPMRAMTAVAETEMRIATAKKWMKAAKAKKAMKRANLKAVNKEQFGKRPKIVVQSKLSGETLGGNGHYFEMRWNSTGIDVRNKINADLKKTVSADVLAQAEVQELLVGDQVFATNATLASLDCKGGVTIPSPLSNVKCHVDYVVLQAVIAAKPILHLFKPCSAWALSSRHWNWGSSGDGCSDESDIDGDGSCSDAGDKKNEDSQGMSVARPEARAVAEQMQSALGKQFLAVTETERRCRLEDLSEHRKGAEVIVISNPSNKKEDTICRALSLERVMRWGFGDCGEPSVKATSFSNVMIGERGYDEFDEDEVKRVKAVTSIIANQLTDHFTFTLESTQVCAPVVYGGVASDGSIVGVLATKGGF